MTTPTYDAYGNPDEKFSRATTQIPAALAAQIAERNVLRYAGYCYDEMSGLYYLSQRYYDAESACFISKDPARADGEESAYQYCAGDPVGSVDPSGMYRQTLWLRWIPGYKASSWMMRQALYTELGGKLAGAASKVLRASLVPE